MADIAAPGLGLSGTLDGEATINGTPAAPSGAFRFKIADLAAPQTRGAGLPPIDADAAGRLEGQRLSLEATLKAGQANNVKISGTAPLSATGPLDLKVTGNLDAGTGGEIIRLLRDLNQQEGLTIIMVTHNMELVAETDRVVRLAQGRVEHPEAHGLQTVGFE